MVVTLDKKGIMRSGIVSAGSYALEDLQFSIPTEMARENEIYLRIYSVANKLYEVVRLTSIRPYDFHNTLYGVIPGQKVRISENERVILKLIFLNKTRDAQLVSNSVECKLQIANYNFTRQIAIAQEIQLATADYFEKISAMYDELVKGENRE